jgi:hypothetical protein
MRLIRNLAALGVCASAVGCDYFTTSPVCATVASPSITVLAVDSISDDTLWTGTKLVQTAADYADSVTAPAGPPPVGFPRLVVSSAYERPGLYAVTVRRAGYIDWVRENVQVNTAECGLYTVDLTARLVPE